jgi:malonyl CoA-acyl carrier protein transacylase
MVFPLLFGCRSRHVPSCSVMEPRSSVDALLSWAETHRSGGPPKFPLSIALFLAPRYHVVAGDRDDINMLEKHCLDNKVGVARSGAAAAFHTDFMKCAEDEVAHAIRNVTWRLSTPVVCNVDGALLTPELPSEAIADRLVAQLTRPVMWEQSMMLLAAGALSKDEPTVVVEVVVGAGSGLATLAGKVPSSVKPGLIAARFKLGSLVEHTR